MKRVDKLKRRSYVSDPAVCEVCRHGKAGCPCAEHLGKGKVIACIGFTPDLKVV